MIHCRNFSILASVFFGAHPTSLSKFSKSFNIVPNRIRASVSRKLENLICNVNTVIFCLCWSFFVLKNSVSLFMRMYCTNKPDGVFLCFFLGDFCFLGDVGSVRSGSVSLLPPPPRVFREKDVLNS
jgi:hypothetical protein